MKGKKIILAITGSIAAYKAAILTRLLIKKGAEVRVIMTPSASKFISPLTLSTLSKNEVFTDVIDENAWNSHVELGLWADAMLIAPATATTISKMASANCDNIVTAVYLSARCPVFVAPAMDRDMWLHPANQNNIEKLKSYNNSIIDVESGELASGLIGQGRMAEPDSIIKELTFFFARTNDLTGKKILITAGPTHEALDPVRFIGNKSSGKMGIAIAEECADRGAQVFLVLGPGTAKTYHSSVKLSKVQSGKEMYEECKKLHPNIDVAIFAAAVADYRPSKRHTEKIKKTGDTLELVLERSIDIAATLGKEKSKGQIHIGFALETSKEEEFALKKLENKNFDFIVLNSLRDKGAGFQHDTNKITIFTNDGTKTVFDLKSKKMVAIDIINTLVSKYLKS